jgi:hypothetical protein
VQSTAASAAVDTAVVHNTSNETIAGIKTFSSSPVVPTPTTSTAATNKAYVDSTVSAGAPDAGTTTKGLVKLAGDLAGTALLPTVPALAGKLAAASNLSDVASVATARTNLGLTATATMTTAQVAGDAALSSTYATISSVGAKIDTTTAMVTFNRTSPNTIVLLGNSRVQRGQDLSGFGGTGAHTNTNSSIFAWANARIGWRFKIVNQDGVGSTTPTDFINRWPTTVAPYAPAWVYISDAVNDNTPGTTSADIIARYQTLINLNAGMGARTILTTTPPRSDFTAINFQNMCDVNNWMLALQDPRVVVADLATAVTDPSTGIYQTAFSDDTVHQNANGAIRQSRRLSPLLSSIASPRDIFPTSPIDTTQIITNPWLTGTVGTGNLPTGWTTAGTPGTSIGLVARTDGIPGNFFEIDNTAAAAGSIYLLQLSKPLPAGAVGKTMRLTIEVFPISVTSLTGLEFFVQLRNSSNTGILQLAALSRFFSQAGPTIDMAGNSFIFSSEDIIVPSAAVSFYIYSHYNGQGVVRFGRYALTLR